MHQRAAARQVQGRTQLAYLQSRRQAEWHNLWHPQLAPLVKDDVVVYMYNSASVLVQKDVIQVSVSQSHQMTHLHNIALDL